MGDKLSHCLSSRYVLQIKKSVLPLSVCISMPNAPEGSSGLPPVIHTELVFHDE